MTTYTMTGPDGKDYSIDGPPGATQEQVAAQMQAHFGQATKPQTGSQPSLMDRVVGSPLGRFTQENVVSPLMSLAGSAIAGNVPLLQQGTGAVQQMEQNAYQGALSRNRNTPGYAAARTNADAMLAQHPSDLLHATLRPLNSTIAGTAGLLGGLDTSNAMADAQTARDEGFTREHPILSGGADLLGSLALGKPSVTLPAKVAAATAPSIATLKSAARQAYQTVDASGMIISKPAVNQLVSDIKTELANKGFHPRLQPKTAAAVKNLETAQRNHSTLQGMEINRRVAQNAVDPLNKSDTMMSRIVVDKIDDFVKNLQPAQLLGPRDDAALKALTDARSLWQKSAKAETIQNLIDKAATNSESMQAVDKGQALRTQFRKLANNPRGMARFSTDEQAAIRKVATGGPVEHVLRMIGKLSPDHYFPMVTEGGMALHGLVTGNPETAALGLGSMLAGAGGKLGASAITKRNARLASELMRLGSLPQKAATVPALQLPKLTAQATFPRGLFGSAWLLNQQLQNQPAY